MGGCVSEGEHTYQWHTEETHRWTELPPPRGSQSGLEMLDSARTGVQFTNTVESREVAKNKHLMHGSGVAIGDVNGDGWPDLYLARLEGPNVLYLNRGDFQFEKVPEAGGAPMSGEYSTGVVLTEITGDRQVDLLVSTLGGPTVVFENDGNGGFTNRRTLHSGQGSTTMALADVSGNGALDLYVANYKRRAMEDSLPPQEISAEEIVRQVGPNEYEVAPRFRDDYEVRPVGSRGMYLELGEPDQIYFNDGNGRFEEQPWGEVFRQPDGRRTEEVPRDWGLVARLEDLNGDGTPDLYVCNDFESPDYYYLGQGEGATFREAPSEVLRTTSHSTMAIATTDIERNGSLDFFLADMLGQGYERQQQQVSAQAPVPREIGAPESRLQEMQNTLQMNRGDATFVEVSRLAGVEASGWTWASTFVDADLDGYDDLLLSNGHAIHSQNADAQMKINMLEQKVNSFDEYRQLALRYPRHDLKNVAFRNQGDGTFAEQDDGWGLGEEADISHGMATGDLDRDGDLDVVINRLFQPVGLYRSGAAADRVAVQLAGQAPNTDGIGATVRVVPSGEEVPAQEKTVIAGGEYVSDSGQTLSFAAGETDSVQIAVRWPTGEETVVEGAPGRLYEIRQPGANPTWASPEAADTSATEQVGRAGSSVEEAGERGSLQDVQHRTEPESSAPTRIFEEVSNRLGHEHEETGYQDFDRQPLLPYRMSQQGPGVAWADLDGDGNDDLLIGTGRGGELAYYQNRGNGQFSRVRGNALDRTYERDLTGIVTIPKEEGATVFIGYSKYERQPNAPADASRILVFEADEEGLRLEEELPFGEDAVGPLALADIDGDEDLDLFAGGRHVPGRYPESSSSALYLNRDGSFQRDASRSRVFESLGMITGATFADVDRDGAPDLLLTSEWGPIYYFRNQGNGRFVDRTEEKGFGEYTGLWRGLDVGDFNGDGRIDVVASNWGWNSKFGQPQGAPRSAETPSLEHPLRVYYADFDENGTMDVIETHYHSERDEYLPFRDFSDLGEGMPYLRGRVRSFERFSQSSLPEIVGERRLQLAETKEVTTLSHMVFLNEETRAGVQFEGHALPWWSQLSIGFAPTVADIDGDGFQDIVLSQNLFATEVKTPRRDGGRALWLKGDGTGQFAPVKGHESGLLVYGEQRAAPVSDVDGDGRVDLLVTQNGAETKLFRNEGATPGLRVRLEGSGANRRAIGATVRLQYEDGTRGPASVITAGSSYWSQHSLTPVLGLGDRSVAAVEVRWPDGTVSEHPVDEDVRVITVPRQE